MLSSAVLLVTIGKAWAHGRMTLPDSRQGGSLEVAGTACGWHDGDSVAECECCWYTDKISTAGATICDPALITWQPNHPDICDPTSGNDWTYDRPWRAPGSAAIQSPCGVLNSDTGTDGVDLPPTNRTKWQRGGLAEVAWAATANHGGGYAYRLCPAAEAPTEACFQANHLAFADDVTTVRFTDGTAKTIAATRTTVGTVPAGSHWSKNPIPQSGNFPPPFDGGEGAQWGFSLVDKVVIPKELALGDYVLSWRWDCELTPQSWANCADVTITDGPSPLAELLV